jgi:hypothetical protein
MLYRRRESLNPVSKRVIAPKVIHRGAADVLISQGCHDAWASTLRNKRPTGAIVSCHYPIRSLEQFHSKVQNAGSGYAANRELPLGVGDRMRYWYDLLQRGHLEDEYRVAPVPGIAGGVWRLERRPRPITIVSLRPIAVADGRLLCGCLAERDWATSRPVAIA